MKYLRSCSAINSIIYFHRSQVESSHTLCFADVVEIKQKMLEKSFSGDFSPLAKSISSTMEIEKPYASFFVNQITYVGRFRNVKQHLI